MILIKGPLTVWREEVVVAGEVALEGGEGEIDCPSCLLTWGLVDRHVFLEPRAMAVNTLWGVSLAYAVEKEVEPGMFSVARVGGRREVVGHYVHSLLDVPLQGLRALDGELYIKVAMTKEEVRALKEKYGQYPLRVLYAAGLLGKSTFIVGGEWLTKGELDLAAKTGASLVHLPIPSQAKATHGFFPLLEAKERGIRVFLGTERPDIYGPLPFALSSAILSARQRYWDSNIDYRPFDLFDRQAVALWEPLVSPLAEGEELVRRFVMAPALFRLKLLWKRGQILYGQLRF